MREPFVSIVMTCHNAERFLRLSIAAALAQDYGNYELIVLDDGSTDGTGQLCQSIADARFHYVRRERLGRARALNEAIKLAKGHYIAINDADDLSLPNRLGESVAALMRSHSYSLIGTGYIPVDEFPDQLTINTPGQIPGDTLKRITPHRLYRSNPFVHSTVMFAKSAWQQVGGYDETLSICIDYDFFLRVSQSGTVGLLPSITVCYYTHPQSHFKKMSVTTYISTLKRIKQRARKRMRLPVWAPLYDLLPYYTSLKTSMRSLLGKTTDAKV